MMIALFAWSSLWAAEPVTKVKSDETVTLFPSLGWRNPSGDGWLIEFHGWLYEQEPRRVSLTLLQKAMGVELGELTAEEKRYFKERTRWFLVDNERGRRFQVTFAGQSYELGKTEANGHVEKLIAVLEATSREQRLQAGTNVVTLNVSEKETRKFAGAVHLVDEEGWTVVSDIDDTIKVTEVRNKKALVRNTFCRAFQPTEGMASVYAGWAEQGAVFHYVSASPWQLYPDLEAFRAEVGYPAGTFHLREMRFKDRSGVEFMTKSREFKPAEIGKLLERFPKRRFVLVGDSGEHDPEIYGELARKHPEQVVRVLIRDVTGEASGSERYHAAFQGVARERWAIFHHPDEVRAMGPVKMEKKGR
jgi:phosphatidate phosphatase APP1